MPRSLIGAGADAGRDGNGERDEEGASAACSRARREVVNGREHDADAGAQHAAATACARGVSGPRELDGVRRATREQAQAHLAAGGLRERRRAGQTRLLLVFDLPAWSSVARAARGSDDGEDEGRGRRGTAGSPTTALGVRAVTASACSERQMICPAHRPGEACCERRPLVPLFSRFLALLHAEAVLRHAYSHYNEHKSGKLQGISTRHGGCVCARERGMQTERNERNDAYAMDGERGAASVEYAGDAGRAAEAEPCRGREKVRVLASTRPARLRSSTRTSTGEMDARTSSSKAGTRSPTTTLPSTAVEAVEEAGATR